MRRRDFKVFLFVFLSIVILIGDFFGFLKPLRGFLEEKLVIPVRTSLRPKARTESCSESQAEILSLKTQIANLKEEIVSTRKLLGAPLPPDWKFKPVKVIGEGEDEIIIGEGETDGIKRQMVVVFSGVFLGKVNRVGQNMAKVRLLSSPDSKETAKIINKDSLGLAGKGLLLGKGKGKMEIKQILAEEEVAEDDLVVVSWDGFDLPAGRIKSIAWQKGEVFKTAEVVRDFNPRNLWTVFLITGKI